MLHKLADDTAITMIPNEESWTPGTRQFLSLMPKPGAHKGHFHQAALGSASIPWDLLLSPSRC